jgi:hypothetical protein
VPELLREHAGAPGADEIGSLRLEFEHSLLRPNDLAFSCERTSMNSKQ